MKGSLEAQGQPKQQHMRGILMMIAAFGMFSLLDAAAKTLQPGLHPPTVIFLRYLIGLVLTLGWALLLRDASLFRSLHPRTQFLRGGAAARLDDAGTKPVDARSGLITSMPELP